MIRKLTTPLSREDVLSLRAGDRVLLSGVVYTARDAAHLRLVEAMERGEALPLPLEGQVIYYAGPTPTPAGRAIGSIGPTTSIRMDAYTPKLLEKGLRGMIGKGKRTAPVVEAMQAYPAVYFAAIGGAAALMASCVTSCEVIAYDDLGPESIKRLTLQELPLVVAVDAQGGDAFVQGQAEFLAQRDEEKKDRQSRSFFSGVRARR